MLIHWSPLTQVPFTQTELGGVITVGMITETMDRKYIKSNNSTKYTGIYMYQRVDYLKSNIIFEVMNIMMSVYDDRNCDTTQNCTCT